MNKRVIRVNIEQEPELYEELMSATMNNTEYEDCYVTQYVEHLGESLQMMGEFTLREDTEYPSD